MGSPNPSAELRYPWIPWIPWIPLSINANRGKIDTTTIHEPLANPGTYLPTCNPECRPHDQLVTSSPLNASPLDENDTGMHLQLPRLWISSIGFD